MRIPLIFWLLSGCVTVLKVPPRYVISVELQPHIKSFEELTGLGVEYPVLFDYTEGTDNAIGVCQYNAPYVLISYSWWIRNPTHHKREQLIWHELGHCSLDLRHDTGRLPDNCPASVMIPNEFISEDCYTRHKAYYKYDLIRNLNIGDQDELIRSNHEHQN